MNRQSTLGRKYRVFQEKICWKKFFRMEKIRIMELLLHCADISNCVKPWNIHTKFTGELLEEFFKQVSHFYDYLDSPKTSIHRSSSTIRKLRFRQKNSTASKMLRKFFKFYFRVIWNEKWSLISRHCATAIPSIYLSLKLDLLLILLSQLLPY